MAVTQLGEAYLEITAKDSGLTQTLNNAKSKVDSSVNSMSQKLAGIGKSMTVVGGVISAAVIGTFKSFTDYETKLTDMAKVTGESFESIEGKISGIDPILGNSTELMSGYYQVISAGIKDPVEALNTLTVAAQTAKAAHVEQSEVVKAITKLMAGYEGEILSTSEAADLLFSIEKEGQTTVGELVPVIGGLAKNSHEVGVSQNEMAAAMATITKTAGSTAEATTQYEAVLTGLMKPTGQMKEAFKGIGEEIRGIGKGYESAEEMIKDLGLVESLKKLEEYTGGSSQALAELFGRKEALVGFSALSAESFQTLNDTIIEVGKGAGSARKAFGDWSETGAASIDSVKNSFTNFSNDIGKILAPMIKELLENISGIIKKISEWAEANPKLMETIVTLGAKIGAIAAVGGPILLAVSAFMKIKGAISLLGTVTTGPIGILILAIGGVYLAWKNWDKIVEFVRGFVENIKGFLEDLKNIVIKKITDMIDWVIKKFEDLAELPTKALQWGKDIITDFVSGITGLIDSLLGGAVGDIIGEFEDIVNLPAKALQWGIDVIIGFADGIKNAVSNVTDAIKGVTGKIADFFKPGSPTKEGPLSEDGGMEQWGYNAVEDYALGMEGAGNLVLKASNNVATETKKIFDNLDLGKAANPSWQKWKKFFDNMKENARTTTSILQSAAQGWANAVGGAFENAITSLLNWRKTNEQVQADLTANEEARIDEITEYNKNYRDKLIGMLKDIVDANILKNASIEELEALMMTYLKDEWALMSDDAKTDIQGINNKYDELDTNIRDKQVSLKSIWETFWESLKDAAIKALAQIIAQQAMSILLSNPLLAIAVLGIAFIASLIASQAKSVGGEIEAIAGSVNRLNIGGKVKGFASGGGTDTVPAMLTPGEYVISKPMVDFIKRTGTVTGNLIDAIRTGARTPVASFAGGGGVSNPISNIVNINAGAIVINTPKFDEADGQRMFQIIERQAKMRGLKLVTA